MHILYVSHGYKPAYRFGGPIMSVSAMAEGMVKRGHRVTVFTTNSNLDEHLSIPMNCPVDVDGVTVWYFENVDFIAKYFWWLKYISQSMGYLFAPAMKRAIIEIFPSVDIVHTQMPFIYPSMIAGRLAAKNNKTLFYNQRGVFHPERLKYRGFKKKLYIDLIEKPIMKKATGLIALTPEELHSYRKLDVHTPCHLVPNGVDVEQFRRKAQPNAFAKFGITDATKVILFLGRLHPSKGIDLLLDAFFKLASLDLDVVLILAGPDEHRFSAGMVNAATSKGLGHRVVVPGMVVGEEKLELLARADVFVLPSTGEGHSMAILEALASGTPVVISPECNFSRVEEVGAGKVVDRDPSKLANAIKLYLTDGVLAQASAQAAYALAKEFSWPPIIERLEHIYLAALGVRNGKRFRG